MSSTPPSVVGFDTDLADTVQVDHLVVDLALDLARCDLLPPDAIVCTHPLRDDDGARGRWAVTVAVSAPLAAAARTALADALGEPLATDHPLVLAAGSRAGGRAVVYPGWSALVGEITVAELLDASAIDAVTVLGSGAPDPGVLLETRGFVRPRWTAGRLVLTAQPLVGDRLLPFEIADPTPCCAAHG